MFTIVKLIFKDQNIDNKEQLLFMEHFDGSSVASKNSFIETIVKSNLYRKVIPTSKKDKKEIDRIFNDMIKIINDSKPIEQVYEINNLNFILSIEYKDFRFFEYFIFNDALILPRNKQYHFVCPSCKSDFHKEIIINGNNSNVEYDMIRGTCICKHCKYKDSIESFITQYSVCEYFVQTRMKD